MVEVCAVAKRDLKAGDVLDDYGMYMTYGEAANVEEMSGRRYLPQGLVQGCRLLQDIAKDSVITYDDVVLPTGRLADRLRAEQYHKFLGETWLQDLLDARVLRERRRCIARKYSRRQTLVPPLREIPPWRCGQGTGSKFGAKRRSLRHSTKMGVLKACPSCRKCCSIAVSASRYSSGQEKRAVKSLDLRASSTSAGASMTRFISNTAVTVARTGAVRQAVLSFGRRRGSSTSVRQIHRDT